MKAFNVKRHNCDGSTTVFRPSDMYDSLCYDYLINDIPMMERHKLANDVIKWARRKPIGSVYEDKILKVEIIDR